MDIHNHHDHHHHHRFLESDVPGTSKIFEYRPINELMSIVRNDLPQLSEEGMIDDGTVVKTIMYCNERLGIPLRQIKQICKPVEEFKATLPLNFEKLYFATALIATNTVVANMRNPFDNNFDRDVIYEANIDRGSFGNADSYGVTINRIDNVTVHNSSTFISLDVHPRFHQHCHLSSPNIKRKGKYTITIDNGEIGTPFRKGEIYMMYLATMEDQDGNILFPFHPLITPYYEWMIKEKVLMDTVFNSDKSYADLLKLAQMERAKAWLDAFDFTTSKAYGEYVDMQRKRELQYWNQYFKYFK